MTQIESPKIVKKKLFSPIWLLPIVALILGAWLGVKSIKESGIEILIHFPSAAGIDIGKTLVKYQGLSVGKVTDIGIDDDLKGVNVKVVMDYRADPFLNKNTLFWLVKPKASITGVEGLDTLFSGNYIAIQPGDGRSATEFEAQREAPAILPGSEGIMIELKSPKLGSIDVGSPVFFRQAPVGSVVSYRLDGNKQIIISAFVQEQYAHLVNKDSHFWNVSGLKIDASLAGIKVSTESIASILAGGISFDTGSYTEKAQNGDAYILYQDELSAIGGVHFSLTATDNDGVNEGTSIIYRGIAIGEIEKVSLTDTGVQFSARVEHQYQGLITSDSQFWLSGADLSLKGIKNLSRLVTGSVINVLPGTQASDKAMQFELASEAPDLLTQAKLKLTVVANTHTGVSNGAQVRYKQLPIGQITSINLSKDFSTVEYQIEILPEFKNLLTKGSFFIPESALAVDASLAGIKVKTRDVTTMLEGAISLIPSNSATLIAPNSTLPLHESIESAQVLYAQQQMTHFTLTSIDGADLTEGSPIYYKKMQIGSVNKINWFAKTDKFNIDISIDNKFVALVKANTVFWRNDAVAINASLAGVDINVAPLKGAINGSIALGHIDETANPQITQPNLRLYDTKSLALMQAKVINLILPVSTKVAEKAAIRYQGHKIGEISHVKLNQDLTTINAQAYIYGQYANHFSASDSEYFIVDAQISLAGINAPETLLTGPYIGVIPGNSLELVDNFVAQPHANFEASVPKDALSFQLVDDQLGSIKVGTPLFFRGIKVGQIDGYQLDKSGIEITLFAHVNAEYSHLINQSSQFWDASGIKLDIGLFSGAQLETGSLETILAGGIAFATRDTTSDSNGIDATSRFPLHKNMQDEWIQWQPLQTK
ncbi:MULTISPECIES: MlaD family protein [Shewanella]|uniref:PqiB family protein n=1 Tax=Shewanella TaxID=22 RepID=UPI000C64E254|nr:MULTISPECIES: MlaD family protein [Shewanella]NCQ43689.1 MCE family protein [Shewanella frigidimarina]NCO70063.1 MCE family protein [Shewanella vesiculosa]NCP35603.1 MCE family protein [Shewanella vesiculosa]NCP68184.1 MCE family protein [Shewanella vesiculosa]NCP72856.1 MCE family protein [Shewanella vesiculosa]